MAHRIGQFLIFMIVGPPVGGFVYIIGNMAISLATRGFSIEPGEGLQMAMATATIAAGVILMVPVLSYFVGFKAALITGLASLIVPRKRLSARRWILICALIGAAVSAALTWQDRSLMLAIQMAVSGGAGALVAAWAAERMRAARRRAT